MVTGHRPPGVGGYRTPNPTEQWVRATLRTILERLLTRDPNLVAISGMALGVDQIFAEEAIGLGIPVHAAVPFKGQERMWPKQSREHYQNLLSLCTEITFVCSSGYAVWKMQHRNVWMIDNSTQAVAVWNGSAGGTGNAVRVLRKRGRKIIHLDPAARTIGKL